MSLKDFTPKQAESWVKQELAKVTTLSQAQSRLETEKEMLRMAEQPGMPKLPNSLMAHENLVKAIRLKFKL